MTGVQHPSGSAAEQESSLRGSEAATIQVCNPAVLAAPGNLSSTTNSSSTPPISAITELNPDKGGTYLQADSTAAQQSQCLDIAAHQYRVCWQVLNVTGYLLDWVSFNRRTCDDKDMGFADCYSYLKIGSQATNASPSQEEASAQAQTRGNSKLGPTVLKLTTWLSISGTSRTGSSPSTWLSMEPTVSQPRAWIPLHAPSICPHRRNSPY